MATKPQMWLAMNTLLVFTCVSALLYCLVLGQTWTPPINSTETDADYVPECSKCDRVRLVGCKRGSCFYRCTRRCLDINGTAYHGKLVQIISQSNNFIPSKLQLTELRLFFSFYFLQKQLGLPWVERRIEVRFSIFFHYKSMCNFEKMEVDREKFLVRWVFLDQFCTCICTMTIIRESLFCNRKFI